MSEEQEVSWPEGLEDWKCDGLHSFRYEGKYAGTSKGQVTHFWNAGIKVLGERKEAVMVWE
jgi:hypothetical protein